MMQQISSIYFISIFISKINISVNLNFRAYNTVHNADLFLFKNYLNSFPKNPEYLNFRA